MLKSSLFCFVLIAFESSCVNFIYLSYHCFRVAKGGFGCRAFEIEVIDLSI